MEVEVRDNGKSGFNFMLGGIIYAYDHYHMLIAHGDKFIWKSLNSPHMFSGYNDGFDTFQKASAHGEYMLKEADAKLYRSNEYKIVLERK